ncbi:hypothetical protein [Lacrimispora aerotolerans]|uniref:hypothetical protein n=1 Tax=Lacrimispora aerotolerans TaxID=36832 RepID=UPI00047E3114|nr:hypothetical protein [Lacrimispora aerotolerans]
MKKRFLGAILSTLLTVTMATPAFAEIIWTADKLPTGYTTNEWENKDFSFYSGNAIKKDTYTYYVKDLHGNLMKNAIFAGGSKTNENGEFILADGFLASFGSSDAEINYILSRPYEPVSWHQDMLKPMVEKGISNYWYGDSRASENKSQWAWLTTTPDGIKDGLMYAYCFNEYGYLYTNTITPDGYMVNGLGQLMIDGKVKTINPREIIANYNSYPIGHLIYDPVTRAQREKTPNPFF